MATAQDIITLALKDLQVVAAEETPSAAESADALAVFNAMISGWELMGVDIGASSLALAGTINLPLSHEEALRANLAVRLAPAYEKEASRTTMALADAGFESLRNAYAIDREVEVDSGLLRMPSQTRGLV